MIAIEELSFRYRGRRRMERVALDGISLAIETGELFGLLGPNGSGKSTLIRILATLLTPAHGSVTVAGLDAASRPDAVRRRLGVAFQSPGLDGKLTVEENLRFQGLLFGMRGLPLERRISELLERFAVAERRHEYVETLSGGLKRRVELAKALLHAPALLLLDEPSTGLDPAVRLEFWNTLAMLRQAEPLTVVVATHLMDEAERCDRVALIDHGRLVALDTPDALKTELGGDVITIEAADAEALAGRIVQRLGVHPRIAEGALRLESRDAMALAASLMAGFGDQIRAIRLGKPTLEDVFLARTGRRLVDAEPHP
ncbi:MAG: ABC transporter ATP-binding protein [Candidatus Lambdaproteobacteria bacterium]|nr:ABC transporter ATP-binding protein [Candidatus Lambdaproteobacteria bacterium]